MYLAPIVIIIIDSTPSISTPSYDAYSRRYSSSTISAASALRRYQKLSSISYLDQVLQICLNQIKLKGLASHSDLTMPAPYINSIIH